MDCYDVGAHCSGATQAGCAAPTYVAALAGLCLVEVEEGGIDCRPQEGGGGVERHHLANERRVAPRVEGRPEPGGHRGGRGQHTSQAEGRVRV